MRIPSWFNVVFDVLKILAMPLLAFYNGVLWSKEKAVSAQVKANEKVNEIHNRVRRNRAKRMRDKE